MSKHNMIEQNIKDVLTNNYMPYTAYVIKERALPEIDGFKPSQRRILYTMQKMGLLKSSRKKSQGIVGQTMFLHPHGDMAIYETLVRMTDDAESLLMPYVDSKGNLGKQYSRDMKYASARYTEIKLTELSKELFNDIDKNAVEMVSNYDGTMLEPKLFPVSFPSILTNPQIGIANGMASSIAPFNINEVIDYTIAYIKNPKNTKVSDFIKAPDFPTYGNIVYNQTVFENIFENGRGSVSIRASYQIKDNSIIFDKMPYTTTFEVIIEKISQLVKDGRLKEVVDVDDIYGINSEGIEITVKNNTNKELLIEKLFKLTPLQSTFPCNFNIMINGRPQVLGVQQIIHEWLAFRVKTIKRALSFDLSKKQDKKHLLIALQKVMLDIDKAIKIIRDTKKNAEVVENLVDAFNFDKKQAEYIAEIKLRHLNKEYLIQRIAEIETLDTEINDLTESIDNRKKLSQILIKQLKEVKKTHGQERKSQIIHLDDLPNISDEEIAIDDYNIKVFVTKEGYLKKIPLTSLRGNNTIKVKDGDKILNEFETTNNSDILIFTNKQNVYKIKSYEIEDHKPSVLGEYLPNIISETDEEILYVTVTSDYKGYLVIGFDDGKVAKIDLKAYETKQNRSMLKNAYANKKAIYWNVINEDIELLSLSSIDKALVFNTSMINPKSSKTTIGVQVMKSKNDSFVKTYAEINDINEDVLSYYRTSNAGVGKYLKKEDVNVLS